MLKPKLREGHYHSNQRDYSGQHELHRKVAVYARSLLVRSRAAASQIAQAAFQSVPDDWQRTHKADDAARSHSARAYVEHVSIAHIVRPHLANQRIARRQNGC